MYKKRKRQGHLPLLANFLFFCLKLKTKLNCNYLKHLQATKDNVKFGTNNVYGFFDKQFVDKQNAILDYLFYFYFFRIYFLTIA